MTQTLYTHMNNKKKKAFVNCQTIKKKDRTRSAVNVFIEIEVCIYT
jgi:hypothetical protein